MTTLLLAKERSEVAQTPPPQAAATRATLLAEVADHTHLPMPPALALQVIDKVSQPNCTPKELAALIQLDPGLCGKLLQTVNSALYGLPRAVTSIDRAIGLLGLRTVRSLVLSLSLPAMQRPSMPAEWMRDYWKSSVAGAIIARELAVLRGGPSAEDDLVAGLLRDLGILVLQQLHPLEYAAILNQPPEVLALRQIELEEEQFGISHADLSAGLLERWRLPRDLTEAIRYHHAPDGAADAGPEIAERAALLHFADRIAQLHLAPACPKLYQDLMTLARGRFGLEEAAFTAFLETLQPKIESFAALMHVDIGQTQNFVALLLSAAEELVRLTVATSIDQIRTREEKHRVEQEAQRWQRAAHRLRRDAVRDPLTGIYNRGSFEEAFVTEFKRCRRRCAVLGLLFLDLDGFKEVNDQLGHTMGDQLLQETAATLCRNVRQDDIVARYGGDEFCVIAADTTEAGLQTLAGRLLHAIRELRVCRGEYVATVGVSVGAVVCFPRHTTHTYGQFLNAADQAMYAAKASGKNRVKFVSLLAAEDAEYMRQIQERLFSQFLLRRGRISEQQLFGARPPASPAQSIGRLARRLGWLSREGLQEILREQRRTKLLFGEIAAARGLLTMDQVYGLLALQREAPEDYLEALLEQDLTTEETVQQELTAYYREVLGISYRPREFLASTVGGAER